MKLYLAIGLLLLGLHGAVGETPTTGPTAHLSYSDSSAIKNPIDVFMYFVPLTSPARVTLIKSEENTQSAWITDYELRTKGNSFSLHCDITIAGSGHFLYQFNPEDVIAVNTRDLDEPGTTRHLDFLRFEGNGFGSLEIEGETGGLFPVITTFTVNFADRGEKSPVTIGMYSVDPVDGVYKYENRYNSFQARVSSLSFQRPENGEPPHMKAKLASLGNSESPDGFFASVKAAFANFFVTPIEITPIGNRALFDFAMSIYLKKDAFTFPLAENLAMAN